jgi:hypothetical protein
MSESTKQKITAQIEGEPVVFLTGMRINKWWKLHLWIPVLAAAIGMQRSLERDRQHGLLGQDAWLGRNLLIVQYWRSYGELERWARNKRERHLPAWLAFVRRIGLRGDVGIWHETYRITPGNHETIYVNMPTFGLAKATQAVPISTRTDSARARMDRTETRAMLART